MNTIIARTNRTESEYSILNLDKFSSIKMEVEFKDCTMILDDRSLTIKESPEVILSIIDCINRQTKKESNIFGLIGEYIEDDFYPNKESLNVLKMRVLEYKKQDWGKFRTDENAKEIWDLANEIIRSYYGLVKMHPDMISEVFSFVVNKENLIQDDSTGDWFRVK